MPYIIRKLPKKDLYRVYNKETKEIHSYGTTLDNAKKQVNLLLSKEGAGLETDKFEDKGIVSLPEFQSVKIELPTYMYKVLPTLKNGKEPKYKYKLVIPTTETRSIATRKQEKSIDIKRKPIPQPFTLYEESKIEPKIEDFSPEDQAKIQEYYKEVKKNEKKDRNEIQEQPVINVPRGFPVTMYKTAKKLGFRETNLKLYQKKQVIEKPVKTPKPPKTTPVKRQKKETKQVQIIEEPVVEFPLLDEKALSEKGSSQSELSSLPSLAKSSKKGSSKSSVSSESSISTAKSSEVEGINPDDYFANLAKKYGKGLNNNNISNNNMNSWVQYVKDYASKNKMKYNEALKDPKCKEGYKANAERYKKGSGIFSKNQLTNIILDKNKVIEDLEEEAYKKRGKGLISDVKKAVKSTGNKTGSGNRNSRVIPYDDRINELDEQMSNIRTQIQQRMNNPNRRNERIIRQLLTNRLDIENEIRLLQQQRAAQQRAAEEDVSNSSVNSSSINSSSRSTDTNMTTGSGNIINRITQNNRVQPENNNLNNQLQNIDIEINRLEGLRDNPAITQLMLRHMNYQIRQLRINRDIIVREIRAEQIAVQQEAAQRLEEIRQAEEVKEGLGLNKYLQKKTYISL